MAKRTHLEMLMKQVGDMLGINYRFHRSQGIRRPSMANAPRSWQFEWWKRVQGNPLNLHGWLCEELGRVSNPSSEGWRHRFAKLKEEKPSASDCFKIEIPNGVKTKDEAIEYVLFKSGLFQETYGSKLTSYDAIRIALDLAGTSKGKFSNGKEQEEASSML